MERRKRWQYYQPNSPFLGCRTKMLARCSNDEVLYERDWLPKCDPSIWTILEHPNPIPHSCNSPVEIFHGDRLVREKYFLDMYAKTENMAEARELARKKFPESHGIHFEGYTTDTRADTRALRNKLQTVRVTKKNNSTGRWGKKVLCHDNDGQNF